MAGGVVETDLLKLAEHCENFQKGTMKLYHEKGDMWFFELYHHLTDCATALRKEYARTK